MPSQQAVATPREGTLPPDIGPKRSRRKNHKWTAADKEVIRNNYDGTRESVDYCRLWIGCSFNGVKGKVAEMGLAKFGYMRKRWTPEEDKLLQELSKKYAMRTVAHLMNRSLNSVVLRSKRIKFRRRLWRRRFYTKIGVSQLLGVDHKWIQARMDLGQLLARPHDMTDGGQPRKGGSSIWHFTKEAVREFILTYPEELQGRRVDMVEFVRLVSGNLRPKRYVPSRQLRGKEIPLSHLRQLKKGGEAYDGTAGAHRGGAPTKENRIPEGART